MLGVRWRYEFAKFDLGADLKQYIPDFYLPEEGLWVEVKPINFDGDPRHERFADLMGKSFIVCKGAPWEAEEYCLERTFAGYKVEKVPMSMLKALMNAFQVKTYSGRELHVGSAARVETIKNYIMRFDFFLSKRCHPMFDGGAKLTTASEISMKMLVEDFRLSYGRAPVLSGNGCQYCGYAELNELKNDLVECRVCSAKYAV